MLLSQARAVWHHSASRFRAVFSYSAVSQPDRCGTLLEVPLCGLADKSGRDIFCFDDRGRKLLSQPIGAGLKNNTLIICRPHTDSKNIFAYFSSGTNAPAAQIPYWGALLCEIRSLPKEDIANWQELSEVFEQSKVMAFFTLDEPALTYNPFNSENKFILRIRGAFNFPQNSKNTLFVAADDAGYFLLDNKIQIERNGRNYVYSSLRGEFRKELTFAQAPQNFELTGINFGGNFALALGKMPNEKTVANIEAKDILPKAKIKLLAVEVKNSDMGNPVFTYEHISYMHLDDIFFTETNIKTLNAESAVFEFDDGLRLQGNSISRIFIGLKGKNLKVRVKGQVASGEINFPEAAPKQRLNSENKKHYEKYFQEISKLPTKTLKDKDSLLAYLTYLSKKEFSAEQVPFAERLLDFASKLSNEETIFVLQKLAEGSIISDPEKAKAAYYTLLSEFVSGKEREELLPTAFDYVLLHLQDHKLAERWLRQFGRRMGRRNLAMLMMQFDLALQQRDMNNAKKIYQQLQTEQDKKISGHISAVQSNALEEKITILLQNNELLEAAKQLQELPKIKAGSRINGSYSLLRAQLLRKIKAYHAALAELEAIIIFDPILPNLPEIEFERAENYREAGQTNKAREIYRKITEEFPNHPVANLAAKYQ